MNQKIIGAILLIAAGCVAAVGTVGAQVANSIVLEAFVNSKMSGAWPASPSETSPHWLIFVMVALLTASGLFCLFGKSKAG
jgi:hypothetical protein